MSTVEAAGRFARLERLLAEATDMVADLKDRDLGGREHATVVIGTRELEISLERFRRRLGEAAR